MNFLLRQDIIHLQIYKEPYALQFLNCLQCKAIKIKKFKSKYTLLNALFIDSKIITFPDIAKSEN